MLTKRTAVYVCGGAFTAATVVITMMWPTIEPSVGLPILAVLALIFSASLVVFLKGESEGDPPSRVRMQKTFFLWEAACLSAGHPIQKEPSGDAVVHLHRLKLFMADNKKAVATAARRARTDMSANAALAMMMTRDEIARKIPDDFEINRMELSQYATQNKIKIRGITDEPA